jgi:ParB family transcriptional regulator, chromosome partitioning protein
MSAKRGLGRNLSALLSQNNAHTITDDSQITKLKWNCLQPGSYQPRVNMAPDALQELAESIKKQGLIQPIVVRKLATENYEIIAGERRWRACQLAQLEDIPVIIRQVNDETALAMALVENLQREDLNAMDQARAMYRLTQEFALTHQQIATLLSKSRAAVSNYLRLLHLHVDVRRMLENGDLDMGHARSLLMLDEAQQCRVAKIVVAKKLSVRETEVLVARIKEGEQPRTANKEARVGSNYQLDLLAQRLQTNVKIKVNRNGTGQLIIHYNDQNRLEKLIEQLGTCVEI